MGNFARMIIDAIQHSMLGSLLVRLVWPCGWLIWLVVDQLTPNGLDYSFVGPVIVLFIASVFLIWLLGAFANRRLRPRPALALERVQEEPANGFGAWSELPEGGLKPPRLIRGIVTAIGASPARRQSSAGFVLALGSFVLAFTLALVGSDVWERVHPDLADPANRLIPALTFAGVFISLELRSWASLQRKLLARTSESSS